MRITLAIVLAAAVAGGLAGAAVGLTLDDSASSTTVTSTSAPAAQQTGSTPEQIYRRTAPGVVVITGTQTEQTSPSTQKQVTALGSGFVIDKKGDIITNDHVVQGATNVRVGFSSGSTYPATVVGTDPSTDVGVVRVNAPASALDPLAFANSASISVGDPVYAIGNPFGLDRTMTAGIVSAKGRSIPAPNGLTIANAIQTDAAINHGNSGGPLLDAFGRVIGINSQIQSGTVNANVGVGFAVPSDTAKAVADQLIKTGSVRHPWLGVELDTIDPTVTKGVAGLPSSGVIVAAVVPRSPAAEAGLKGATREVTVNGVGVPLGGDVIVSVDGKRISTSQQLGAIVAAHEPGDRLQLGVVRNGRRRTVTVTLGDVPSSTS
jgi:S1-C subfamily serine protease